MTLSESASKSNEELFRELYEEFAAAEWTNKILGRHVPDYVRNYVNNLTIGKRLESIVKDENEIIGFSDLVDFTVKAGKLTGDELNDLIQQKFKREVQIFERYNIKIEGYQGDATLWTAENKDKESVITALQELKYASRKLGIEQTVGVAHGRFQRLLVGEDRLEPLIIGEALHSALRKEKEASSLRKTRKTKSSVILLDNFDEEEITEEKEFDLGNSESENQDDKREFKSKRRIEDKVNDILSFMKHSGFRTEGEVRNFLNHNESFREFEKALIESIKRLNFENQEYKRLFSHHLSDKLESLQKLKLSDKIEIKDSPATTIFIKFPAGNISELNEKFTLVQKTIEEREGIRGEIDKVLAVDPDYYVIMATFGRTKQSEFDHEAAASSALEIRKIFPEASIGLASGDVLSVTVGYRENIRYTLTGDATNLAARIGMTFAKEGSIWIPKSEKKFLANFNFGKEEDVFLKGKGVQALSELISERERYGKFYELGIVGRDEEINSAKNLFERFSAHRLGIEGDAGIGKSRFCFEIEGIAKNNRYSLYTGACFVRDEAIPYRSIANLLRDIRRHKNVSLGEIARFILGENKEIYSITNEEIKERLIQELEELVRNEKTILFFRDIHWMDSHSRNLISDLSSRLKDTSIWYASRNKEELINNAVKINLGALDEKRTRDYAKALLNKEGKEISEEEAKVIFRTSKGVPLDIEESAQYIIEGGDINKIPNKRWKITSGRFSNLSDESQEILKIISVFGHSVNRQRLLNFVSSKKGKLKDYFDEALEELVKKRFIGGGRNLFFLHDLIHKAIYVDSKIIKSEERKQRHLETAEFIEENEKENDGKENEKTNIEDLAHHYSYSDLRKSNVMDKASHYKRLWGLELFNDGSTKASTVWEEELWNAYDIARSNKSKLKILSDLAKGIIDVDRRASLKRVNEEYRKINYRLSLNERREFIPDIITWKISHAAEQSNNDEFEKSLGSFRRLEKLVNITRTTGGKELKLLLLDQKTRCITRYSADLLKKGSYSISINLADDSIEELNRALEDYSEDDERKAGFLKSLAGFYKVKFNAFDNLNDKEMMRVNKILMISAYKAEHDLVNQLGNRRAIIANAINYANALYVAENLSRSTLNIIERGIDLAKKSGYSSYANWLMDIRSLFYLDRAVKSWRRSKKASLSLNNRDKQNAKSLRFAEIAEEGFKDRIESKKYSSQLDYIEIIRHMATIEGITGNFEEASRVYSEVVDHYKERESWGNIRHIFENAREKFRDQPEFEEFFTKVEGELKEREIKKE